MDNSKSILLISWSLPPIKGPRSIKSEAILKGFYEKFEHITLVTRDLSSNYVKEKFPNASFIPMASKEIASLDIDVKKSEKLGLHWLKRMVNGLLTKFCNYPDIMVFFRLVKAFRRLRSQNFDYALSIDGPQTMHWAVAYLRWRNKLNVKVWIADNGDPLTRNLPGNMVAPYFKYIEDWFCEKTDILTVPVYEGYGYFKTRFRKKIQIVKHSLIFPSKKEFSPTGEISSTNMIHMAYAGNMMPYQAKAKLFFKQIGEMDLSFTLHIYGSNGSLVRGLVAEYPMLKEKVIDHGLLEREKLLLELQEMHFLVYFPYNDTGQVPFKLIDYAFTGLPVLRYDLETKESLKSFLDGDYTEKEALPNYQDYHYADTTAEYVNLFERFEQ
jgi:hypothetical protein